MANITFLGTSGSVVTKRRMCAGILFDDKLLDIGFGVLTNFLRSGRKLSSINEVYITHTHSDHIGDFTGLIWAMAMDKRKKPFRVVGSTSIESTLKKILKLQATPREGFVNFDIEFVSPKSVGIEIVKTIHSPENLAYKFKTKSSEFVYTGDTAEYPRVAEFAKGCDLLIHDGTYVDGEEFMATLAKHSTGRQAGKIAEKAGAKKLVLTHISPANDGADSKYIAQTKSEFRGTVTVARDYLTLKL
jgi:ribonuclease BN (tRNA processing enzyme)